MVVTSGIYPYSYHTSSWPGAVSGQFRIPTGQLVQPSAVHFEETMYVAKAEYNRVVTKSPTYISAASSPTWFLNNTGRFALAISNQQSGWFDPTPTGDFLSGKKRMILFNNTNSIFGAMPGAVHQQIYIDQLRQLLNHIFDYYGTKGGGWKIDNSTSDLWASGARKDWLTLYKGYDDNWALSGLFYHDAEMFSGGLMYDRYLDEVRLQPMPFFGLADDIDTADFWHQSPWGVQNKYYNFGFRPLRPRYMKTDGTLPTGWTSGLQIGLNTTTTGTTPLSGMAGHLISGICITLSGGGDGKQNHMRLVSGIYNGYLANESFPDSPSYISLTNLTPSGASTIPSGQYRVMLSKPNADLSFPWGASGSNVNKSAIWPWDNYYEPYSGIYVDGADDFFPFYAENSSFWVTDYMFAYQHSHGGTTQSPYITSGIYWYQMNAGPSKSACLLDGWTTLNFQSGLWGLTHGDEIDVTDGGSLTQRMAGGGWCYDRTNNYYVKVGYSGLPTVSTTKEASGVYERYNQQMNQITSVTPIAGTTINGIYWNVSQMFNMCDDGTNWVVNGNIVSGLYDPNLISNNHSAWIRLDSSFAIVDAVISTIPTLGWVHYARGTSEYLHLNNNRTADDYHGVAGSKYSVINSITWGDLQNADSTGSGTYSTTQYTMTYDVSVSSVINLATATAQSRVHIEEFFDAEDGTNDLYCVIVGFAAGSSSGTGDPPSVFVAKVDTDGGHPYNVVQAWRLHSLGTFYNNFIANAGLKTIDGCPDSMEHIQIH